MINLFALKNKPPDLSSLYLNDQNPVTLHLIEFLQIFRNNFYNSTTLFHYNLRRLWNLYRQL